MRPSKEKKWSMDRDSVCLAWPGTMYSVPQKESYGGKGWHLVFKGVVLDPEDRDIS